MRIDPGEWKKGRRFLYKAPPFFDKEYVYVVTACGEKTIRADLEHSPTVKKNWTLKEFALLIEHEVVTLL